MTQLLDTTEFRLGVESAVSRATASVTILSAYLKHQALDHLMSLVPEGVEVRVASRFRPNDLISGASDIDAAKLLIEKGAKFGISPRLHGKVFLIDDQDMYIGSSNLTGSGFGLAGTGNEEFGTHCHAGQADVKKLDVFLRQNVVWLDAVAIETMECELDRIKSTQQLGIETEEAFWSFEKANKRELEGIWFRELPPCTPSQASQYLSTEGEFSNEFLAGAGGKLNSLEGLQQLFFSSVAYQWLVQKLEYASSDSVRFGELTALLHASLFDDPAPYRSSIKRVIADLFTWVELIPDELMLIKHKQTRSIARRNRRPSSLD